MRPYTHLRVHSRYTLLGSTAPVAALAERAAADGLTHLALTDTNALYGAVAFVQACRRENVQPILGMTITVALPADLDRLGDVPGHLALLATGPAGYRSLCRLSSLIQGSPNREQIVTRGVTLDDLQANAEGLICLTGGRQGWISRALAAGASKTARRFAGRLAYIYGERDTYLSLELDGPDDLSLADATTALGERLGLPTVAVQPVYALTREEAARIRLLRAIDLNCPIDQVPAAALPRGGDPAAALHWLPPAEMAARYAALPDALARSGEIAKRCKPALPDGTPVWPHLDLPADSPSTALARLAREGAKDRYGVPLLPAVQQRLVRELAAIDEHGYAPLFLVVADVVHFAREKEIPVSTRGSVANSLVAYCTGITTVDPIAHDLLFERFLSPARADPPDIDLDFCSRRRDEVLAYVRRTYGEDHVSLVGTVSTMRLRSAVRETAKAYGLAPEQTDRLIKDLPRSYHPGARRRGRRTLQDILDGLTDPRLVQVVREAAHIVGQPHHLGVHPGGVVITPGPLTDVVPVQWAVKGFLITQFDHRDVGSLGLPKIDLLGISALTVLADAARLVRRDHDPEFRLERIPFTDQSTGDLLSRGETVGVFQCESQGARSTLRKLQARSVQDLAVANAFFKPGPSTGGMARTFVQRYRGEEPVAYLHPALEPILAPTKGVLIFQEQVLRVAVEIAGLSWEQAGHLRRGMSKMRQEDMNQIATQFIAGCRRPAPEGPEMSPDQARRLWEQVLAFSGYGFNQGHATAYAVVSYQMAYIKARWPAVLLCARLANWGGFHHPALTMAEAVHLGIDVRPPHVNHSQRAFCLSWEAERPVLWMGLGQVRDLRRSAVHAIVAARECGPFTGLRDLLQRVDLQAKEVRHLIECGALDGLGGSRPALLVEAREISRAGSARQLPLFEQNTLRGSCPEPDALSQRAAWERLLLGYPVSLLHQPLALAMGVPADSVPLARVAELAGQRVTCAGVRLPGWTGGPGFHLWDGETWVVARQWQGHRSPPPWEPLIVRGRWTEDAWRVGWLKVDSIRVLPTGE